MKNSGKICFIGAGKMATAIAGGLVSKGLSSSDIKAYDPYEAALTSFNKATGAFISSDLKETLKDTQTVVIAVKPQNMHEALGTAKEFIADKLLISIAAGVTIKTLEELSGCERVVRVMPNTPASIGEAVSAYSPSSYVTAEDIKKTEDILSSIGEFCMVNEKLMDAVTGLSGSGPAYVFDFIQALSDGGVNAGLPRDTALKLATQTVLGAAKMLKESGEHPSVLRDQVTSPGGTTIRALATLEKGSFRGLVSSAVLAAAERSAELGKK